MVEEERAGLIAMFEGRLAEIGVNEPNQPCRIEKFTPSV
jgi:hypothetical protein